MVIFDGVNDDHYEKNTCSLFQIYYISGAHIKVLTCIIILLMKKILFSYFTYKENETEILDNLHIII